MIRILHIVGSISTISGVMNFIMNYYKLIDKEKVQFDFLYFIDTEDNFNIEINKLGGNTYFVNKPSVKNILQTFKEFEYLVHFINHFCKKYNIKHLITHAHTTKYSDNPKNALRNRIMCFGLNNTATDLFACSKAAGEFYYGKKAVKGGKVKIIPNAINLEKYKFNETIRNKLRKELNIENKFVIGHIGRMAPPKNQKFLLKIFREVKKEKNNAILLIIGDGPLRNEIEKEIDNLNIGDSVILLGVRNDVPELLMAMDVFVLPSLYEGLPVVCVEAQAAGLRCMLSDNITKEVDCGLCEFIPLDKSPSIWRQEILKKLVNNRNLTINKIINDKFSIIQQSKILEKLYFEIRK